MSDGGLAQEPLPPTATCDHSRLSLAIHRLGERTMKMSMESFPIGQEMDVTYPNFKVSLTLLSGTRN